MPNENAILELEIVEEENENDLLKFAFLGDELIELDESMSLVPELCDECKLLGYCKKTKEAL